MLARGIDRIKALSGVILAAVAAQRDFILVGLAGMLPIEHGPSFAVRTVWRCLGRHSLTVKNSAYSRA